jgi:hypothetical protein
MYTNLTVFKIKRFSTCGVDGGVFMYVRKKGLALDANPLKYY